MKKISLHISSSDFVVRGHTNYLEIKLSKPDFCAQFNSKSSMYLIKLDCEFVSYYKNRWNNKNFQ